MMPEEERTMTAAERDELVRDRERKEYRLTKAQYVRFRELLAQPAAAWSPRLQRWVLVAIEREGQRRDAVLWAVATYCRLAVPTRKESR